MDGIPATAGARRAHGFDRRVALALAVAVAVVAAAASLWWWQHRPPAHPAVVARPAPAVRPVPVAAAGACAAALAPLRGLIATAPSGSLLSADGNRRLTDGLARVDTACDASTAAAFRRVEVVPWLTYLPPSGGSR
jgi:hypothetical protein